MKSVGNFGIKCLFAVSLTISLAVIGVGYIYSDGTPPIISEDTMLKSPAERGEASCAKKNPACPEKPANEPFINRFTPPAECEEFSQNHLAKMVTRVLGLEDRLPAAAGVDDYFNLLTTVGVAPMDGWEVDAPVTRDDLAVVMVQALGLQGEVEDSLDPQCYIDVLKSEGVDLEKGMFNVEHGLSFPTVVNSFDALKFGDTVSDNFNTALSPMGNGKGY